VFHQPVAPAADVTDAYLESTVDASRFLLACVG
jgi:hypothetical protein